MRSIVFLRNLRFLTNHPLVGSVAAEGGASEEQRIQDLSAALQKLPRVHLYVLDALISHFKT